ncbi:MAG: hypothetical protein LBL30_00190 [Holosporales bacterium]|jgi:hypothetical protein|nr:hypothetical protein [Holosporales bacterium]
MIKLFNNNVSFILSDTKDILHIAREGSGNIQLRKITKWSHLIERSNENFCILTLDRKVALGMETTPPLSWGELRNYLKGQADVGKCYLGKFVIKHLFSRNIFHVQTAALNGDLLPSELHSSSPNILGIFPLLALIPLALKKQFNCDMSGWWIFVGRFLDGIKLVGGYQNNCIFNLDIITSTLALPDMLSQKINEAALYMRRYKWTIDQPITVFSNMNRGCLDKLNLPDFIKVIGLPDAGANKSNSGGMSELAKLIISRAASRKIFKSPLLVNKHKLWLVRIKRYLCNALCASCVFLTTCLGAALVWRPWTVANVLSQKIEQQRVVLENSIKDLCHEFEITGLDASADKLVSALKLTNTNTDCIWKHLNNISAALKNTADIIGLKYERKPSIKLFISALPDQVEDICGELGKYFSGATAEKQNKSRSRILLEGNLDYRKQRELFTIDLTI